MSAQLPKTIVCPRCGNTNAYTAETCLKCDLPLAPIRDAMLGSSTTSARNNTSGGQTASTSPSAQPVPKSQLPELPARQSSGQTENLGKFVDSWRVLVRGMGDRANDVSAYFFQQISERGIENASLSQGQLIIEGDKRDYYFVERVLSGDAKATMAVRIAPQGKDLFVEWRNYVLPPKEFGFKEALYALPFLGAALFCMWGAGNGGREYALCWGLIFGGIAVAGLVFAFNRRSSSPKGFQSQDNATLQLSVRAAIDEAIDLAGISKALMQQLPSDGRRI